MLVANSFDLWQKDTFFSAAEEVQQSADIMESAYRTWKREKREGLISDDLDELCRELQIALGTAKWQLEEFEKAVRLSYRRADDVTAARHGQFVDAIENQISRVETALRESLSEKGKQPLRWVNLNEEECDDLAAFLSGAVGTSQTLKDECAKVGASSISSLQETICLKKEGFYSNKTAYSRDISSPTKKSKDVLTCSKDSKLIGDIEAAEIPGTRDDINCQNDRISSTKRTWSLPDFGALKIVVAKEDEQKNALVPSLLATPKDKGSKPVFWRQRCGDHPKAMGELLSYTQWRGIRCISQILGQVGGIQRQPQSPLHLKLSSVRFKLALMLTIFLMGKLLIYLNMIYFNIHEVE